MINIKFTEFKRQIKIVDYSNENKINHTDTITNINFDLSY